MTTESADYDLLKTLIPDFTDAQFGQALRDSTIEELQLLSKAFGYDFDENGYIKNHTDTHRDVDK